MNQLQTINQLPSTKDQISSFIEAVKTDILSGNVDPLKTLIQIRAASNALSDLASDDEIINAAVSEFEKYNEKQLILNSAVIEKKETGVKYDYSVDRLWKEIKSAEDSEANKRKERETFLKAIKYQIADVDTGEIIYPPAKSSKTNLVITIK
jgi:hypothetical protein